MNPIAAIAVKLVGASTAAALLSIGIAGAIAQAASPSPKPPSSAVTTPGTPDPRSDRRAIRVAVFESEADVLGITPRALSADLKQGKKVSDLANDKGMNKAQFADKLVVNLKPRLAALVERKMITQTQADRVVDRISKGHIPFWNGRDPRKAAPATPAA